MGAGHGSLNVIDPPNLDIRACAWSYYILISRVFLILWGACSGEHGVVFGMMVDLEVGGYGNELGGMEGGEESV